MLKRKKQPSQQMDELSIELERLKHDVRQTLWERRFKENEWNIERVVKLVGVAATVAAGIWSVVTYVDTQSDEAEVRKIEASKAFLTKQLTLFEEVTQVASRLATAPRDKLPPDDLARFRELYWGELALVEQGKVEAAMFNFDKVLNNPMSTEDDIHSACLNVAHSCRTELAQSWQVDAWLPPARSWFGLGPPVKE